MREVETEYSLYEDASPSPAKRVSRRAIGMALLAILGVVSSVVLFSQKVDASHGVVKQVSFAVGSSSATAPTPTTAKPAPTTAKPVPTTKKPSPTTAKPTPTTAKPTPSTLKPSPTTVKPSPTTTKPSPTTAKPSSTTTKPSPTTPAPTTSPPSPPTSPPTSTPTPPPTAPPTPPTPPPAAPPPTPTPSPTPPLTAPPPAPAPTPSPAPPSPPKTVPGQVKGGVQQTQTGIVTMDGEVGNPTEYPDMGCALPNYVSRNGKIYVIGPQGQTEALTIKGVNWFGMETSATLPLGLWSNPQTGTTAYAIAAFLARNNFNSVRLPICVESLVKNIAPNKDIVNQYENRAIQLNTHLNPLKGIIKALGHRQISVMISLHTLTTSDRGALWYSNGISEQTFLQGVDILTKNLCTSEFWNVIGLDLKNEPSSATWGDGSGISENRVWTSWSTGRTYYFMDWWGCGLSKAKQYPVSLKFGDKVVYAPHYYPPNVYPSEYFFGEGFSELPDYQLKANVQGTFDLMFGYLAQDPSSPALVLGEFGGLYTNDLNPGRTIQRAVNYTVELLMRPGFVGGYMWSLNPESGYDYNRRNVQGTFKEGLLQNDWRTANEPYLAALSPTDKMADLKRLPCFKCAP